MPSLLEFARKRPVLCLSVALVLLSGIGLVHWIHLARAERGYVDWKGNPFVSRNGACDSERSASHGDEAPMVVAGLVEALRDRVAGKRYRAALCLGEMGTAAGDAVPALTDAVQDTVQVETFDYDYFYSSTVGEAAIEALGRIGVIAAPALLDLQGDTDPAVRDAAFDALSRIFPDAEAGVPFFSRALHSRVPEERTAAARLLREYLPGARNVVALLRMAMGDADANVRAAAARGLGRVAEQDLPVAVPLLIDSLADEDAVREAGVIAFRSFHRRFQHNERIAEIGPTHVATLVASIASESPEMRRRAIWIVRAIGPSAEDAMPAVIAALNDEDVRVRNDAIRALYRFPHHAIQVTPTLLEFLSDPRTARSARIVLDKIGVDDRLPSQP